MSRACPTLKDWIVALENAAWSLLGDWVIGKDEHSYRLYAEPCDKHGSCCARVVYGMLLDHVRWRDEDPAELAGRLVRTMIPPEAQRPAPGGDNLPAVSDPSGEPPGGQAHEPIYRWHAGHAPCSAGRHASKRMAVFHPHWGEWFGLHPF
jgi:hypothetical protein